MTINSECRLNKKKHSLKSNNKNRKKKKKTLQFLKMNFHSFITQTQGKCKEKKSMQQRLFFRLKNFIPLKEAALKT